MSVVFGIKYLTLTQLSHHFPLAHSARFLLMHSPLELKLFNGRFNEIHAPNMTQLHERWLSSPKKICRKLHAGLGKQYSVITWHRFWISSDLAFNLVLNTSASHLTCLSLSFLRCKTKITIPTFQNFLKDYLK